MTALGLSPSLQIDLRQECGVCREWLTTARLRDGAAAVALFGVSDDPYAVCPSCCGEIPEPARRDEPFRLRVRRHYFARGIILHQDATGRWLKRSID